MKNFIIPFLFLFPGFHAKATIFIVTVTDNQFTPSNIPNVVVGDVIQFNFAAVNNHNATSTPLGAVPAGAANIFSGNLGAVTTSYSYAVTLAGNYRYYCMNHSADGLTGMVGTFTATTVMPVILKNFNVIFSGDYINAQWQTSAEQNVAYFSLLKSTDGKKYTEAGRVNATGNSNTTRSYNYKDVKPGEKIRYIYYELKIVDNDGNYSFSPVKLIRNNKATPALITQISPNPVSRAIGHLIFQFNADRNCIMKAMVKDASGKNVMNIDLHAVRGINNGHIHMGSLPAGLYTVYFSLDGIREIQKVMVIP